MVAKKGGKAGTIYRYFSDKDDLIRQLYQHTILKRHPLVMEGVQIEEVSYEQYRRLWLNIDAIFTSYPNAPKGANSTKVLHWGLNWSGIRS